MSRLPRGQVQSEVPTSREEACTVGGCHLGVGRRASRSRQTTRLWDEAPPRAAAPGAGGGVRGAGRRGSGCRAARPPAPQSAGPRPPGCLCWSKGNADAPCALRARRRTGLADPARRLGSCPLRPPQQKMLRAQEREPYGRRFSSNGARVSGGGGRACDASCGGEAASEKEARAVPLSLPHPGTPRQSAEQAQGQRWAA